MFHNQWRPRSPNGDWKGHRIAGKLRGTGGIEVALLGALLVLAVSAAEATVIQVGGPSNFPGGTVALPGGSYRDLHPLPILAGDSAFPSAWPMGIYGAEIRRGDGGTGGSYWELGVGPYTNLLGSGFAFFNSAGNLWDGEPDTFTLTWTPSSVMLSVQRVYPSGPQPGGPTTVSWGSSDFGKPEFTANDDGLPFAGDSRWDVGNAVRVSARGLSDITIATLDGSVLSQFLQGPGQNQTSLSTLYFAGTDLLDGWVMTGSLNVGMSGTSQSWKHELLVTVGTYDGAMGPASQTAPEPGTLALVGAGLLGLGAVTRLRWPRR